MMKKIYRIEAGWMVLNAVDTWTRGSCKLGIPVTH